LVSVKFHPRPTSFWSTLTISEQAGWYSAWTDTITLVEGLKPDLLRRCEAHEWQHARDRRWILVVNAVGLASLVLLAAAFLAAVGGMREAYLAQVFVVFLGCLYACAPCYGFLEYRAHRAEKNLRS
jgi:hypothetical protein